MKKVYEKPMFFADEYQVTSSIAACDIHKGEHMEGYPILLGNQYCSGNDNGQSHHYTTKSPAYKFVGGDTTIFDDGSDTGCVFDWASLYAPVYAPDGVTSFSRFSSAFYSNNSDPGNHAPADNHKTFFS